ncbi:hypothetical protein [Candidatus Nitrosacidococcus tergens]|uniref:Uncharacterized protein n=1 Tax=Candidatus Nitrosacidococcus tergens TaxID=553981 RepID=A0A7G1QAE7_9GAMM|nr:hypothetical protein [Candidatus Nitrosacidococcus tergens]CAB1275977.1 conserved protein of unknown function [Candidatus Nitrosacidococcus tergens]
MINNKRNFAISIITIFCLLNSPILLAEEELVRTSWFGGPVYDGDPDLSISAALIQAGGGEKNFSFKKALVSMLGEKAVNQEVIKLTEKHGTKMINSWMTGMDFAVNSAIKHMNDRGIKFPDAPTNMTGVVLAKTLIKSGTAPDGAYWGGWMFDNIIPHSIHNQVMIDIDNKHDYRFNKELHCILNLAMYDVAQSLGETQIKLSALASKYCTDD